MTLGQNLQVSCLNFISSLQEMKRSHDSSLTPADFNLGGQFTKDVSLRLDSVMGSGAGGEVGTELEPLRKMKCSVTYVL